MLFSSSSLIVLDWFNVFIIPFCLLLAWYLHILLLCLFRNYHIYPQLIKIKFASWNSDSLFIPDIHSFVGFTAISSLCQFFPCFHYFFLFTCVELTSDLIETLKAGRGNGENSELGGQRRYHHGTKETIFDLVGFCDITFSFAPVMFPLEFLSLWFFATDLPITLLPSLSFLLSPTVPFSSSVLV